MGQHPGPRLESHQAALVAQCSSQFESFRTERFGHRAVFEHEGGLHAPGQHRQPGGGVALPRQVERSVTYGGELIDVAGDDGTLGQQEGTPRLEQSSPPGVGVVGEGCGRGVHQVGIGRGLGRRERPR